MNHGAAMRRESGIPQRNDFQPIDEPFSLFSMNRSPMITASGKTKPIGPFSRIAAAIAKKPTTCQRRSSPMAIAAIATHSVKGMSMRAVRASQVKC